MSRTGNIIRNIGNSSTKTGKQIHFLATDGNLNFNSVQEVVMQGKENGTKFEDCSAVNNLKIVSIEGPYNENWEKVSKVEKANYYNYKAIADREISSQEKQLLKWDRDFDGNGNYKIFKTGGTVLENNSIGISYRIGTDNTAKKLTLYAYFSNREDEAKLEVKLCNCPCSDNLKVTIKNANSISNYTGDFPSPFQVMRYTSSRDEPILHNIYVPDSTIRSWVKDAADYHGIPHEMLAVIIQQENAPNSSKFRQFLQYIERSVTTEAAVLDESLWGIIPDKLADGSSGFMNMRRPTLTETINYTKNNYCKELMPPDVANREGYISDTDADTGVQGADWRADLYYGAAHIRQLIDRQIGVCSVGEIDMEQVEKVFASYNGSGPIALKYGSDAISLLKGAYEGSKTLFFYEK